jgi:geranylgeranyl diphosphate synthase type II
MLDFDTARQIVDREMDKLRFDRTPEALYEPVKYILSLGGKRMRPALGLMACSLFNQAVHLAIKPALAIELFHNFTLIHDDIIDQSSVRRGQPAVHEKWDTNAAILSGDVMAILSYQVLADVEESQLKEIFQLFNQMALQVCEGQQLDINFEDRTDVDVNEYLKMIELKTAVLIASSLKAGALAGGAEMLDADLLYEFGRNLGIAFQLQDDYLDVFGDPGKTGKKIGNDILSNKKTFLLIKALELAKGNTRKELLKLIKGKNANPKDKIRDVINIYLSLQLDEISNELADSHYSRAIMYLDRVNIPGESKKPLADFAEFMINRDH